MSISSREFNHDVTRAKRATADGPVVITDRGRPSHVLMSIEDYVRLQGDVTDIVARLSVHDDLDFDIAPLPLELQVPEL